MTEKIGGNSRNKEARNLHILKTRATNEHEMKTVSFSSLNPQFLCRILEEIQTALLKFNFNVNG